MRIIFIGLVGIFLLTACGTPSPELADHTPNPTDEVTTTEAIASDIPVDIEIPPPITDGTFTQRMSTSINEALFEENDAGAFSVFGAIVREGLIYLYLHNGGSVYYAVSSNGSDWALSPEPVFNGLVTDDFEYFPNSIQAIHEGYAIYCGSATVNYALHDYLYSVWIISAPEPTGPWTFSEFPSLVAFHTGVEDPIPFHVSHPIVRPYLDGFRMYYAFSFTLEGLDTPEFAMAHSWDGLVWRFTSELPTPESAIGTYPISLSEEYDWSGFLVLDVWPTEVGWQMLYLLDEGEGELAQIYLADSEDGLKWVPSDIDIQLPVDQLAEDLVAAYVVYNQGQYMLTYCTMPQPHQYQCYIVANDSDT